MARDTSALGAVGPAQVVAGAWDANVTIRMGRPPHGRGKARRVLFPPVVPGAARRDGQPARCLVLNNPRPLRRRRFECAHGRWSRASKVGITISCHHTSARRDRCLAERRSSDRMARSSPRTIPLPDRAHDVCLGRAPRAPQEAPNSDGASRKDARVDLSIPQGEPPAQPPQTPSTRSCAPARSPLDRHRSGRTAVRSFTRDGGANVQRFHMSCHCWLRHGRTYRKHPRHRPLL